MDSHVVSETSPLPASFLWQFGLCGGLDEIPNSTNSVRHHIFWFGRRNRATGKIQYPFSFFIYQTRRHGPQNGFRLCIIHPGFPIASDTKPEGSPEDDIDRLERDIPQGHMEVVVLGEKPVETSDIEIDFEDGSDSNEN